MAPCRPSKIKKSALQAMLGFSLLAISNAGLAATALIKVKISLPQVLTTSLSKDVAPNPASLNEQAIQNFFNDSRNNGYLHRAENSTTTGNAVTFLYIQT